MGEATFTFRVDEELKQQFFQTARSNDRSGAQLLRDLMRDYIAQQQQESVEYDEWFRDQVKIGLDSANAGRLVSADEVEVQFAAKREAARKQFGAAE
ncbi:MAG: hypothetical protein D6B27_04050 [Gammaproteobacteria bacterium]|nr:MAG: hypothetical protein D6B27_04050 [Gammaproteobacteria bacterium]